MKPVLTDTTDNQNRYISVIILFLVYVVKYILYRYLVDEDALLTPLQLLGTYLACASAAALLACCVLLTRSVVPSIVLLCLTDLWLLANILYYNANSVLIDWDVILFANQIRGFESSIIAYLSWKQILFPLTTITTAASLIAYQPPKQEPYHIPWKFLLITLACTVTLFLGSCLCQWLKPENNDTARMHLQRTEKRIFYSYHSPLAHFGYVLYDAVREGFFKINAAIPLTAKEEDILSAIYTNNTLNTFSPEGHLVLVLVESFESWALDAKDIDGNDAAPNLNRYIRQHNVLISKNIVSQQKFGRSGDGQLITQTGLLPLLDGVTCMRFGHNVYPNYAHFFPSSVILDPYKNVWNQRVTTYSYGYKRLHESELGRSSDSIIFSWAREELELAVQPTCILAITINTHSPFKSVPTTSIYPDTYTGVESDYLQTVHYMDKHLGLFLDWADTATVMQNSTIVITADHNHFPVTETRGRCPLIIKSPAVTATTIIPKAYQMDIFPTVLAAIGQTSYFWHGFGINLLDSTAVRTISAQKANDLSDKMIRNNFFNSTTSSR